MYLVFSLRHRAELSLSRFGLFYFSLWLSDTLHAVYQVRARFVNAFLGRELVSRQSVHFLVAARFNFVAVFVAAFFR